MNYYIHKTKMKNKFKRLMNMKWNYNRLKLAQMITKINLKNLNAYTGKFSSKLRTNTILELYYLTLSSSKTKLLQKSTI